jgi:hypothetical protein
MKRKVLLLLMLFLASALSLNCQTKPAAEKVNPCKYLSFAEAEKILGQRVRLITNSWDFKDDKTRFDCTYRSIEKDKTSGWETSLFFTLEESADEVGAKQIYTNIWNLTENHAGIEILSGIGDEAYARSDVPNFHFLMARKGKFTIRLKINKAVETTSFDELKAFAKKVIGEI